MNREEALGRLRGEVEAGRPIIGAGAGTGLSAKCAEAGGVDLIIIYNSGRYRMAGRGSLAGLLPYGDANAIVVDMASEVLARRPGDPVLAGVCGTDPFRLMPVFLKQLKEMGFSGVQNFPTVGLFDGTFRQNLEETGMGFDLEVEMIRQARDLDLLTSPYVFDEDEARAMAEAGADVLVPHMGLTTSGTIGAQTALTLDESVERVQAMHDAAKEVKPGRPRPLSRRPDRVSRRRRIRAGAYGRRRRVLRGVEHGAAADGEGDDREHARVQTDRRGRLEMPQIDPHSVPTQTFEWGAIKWFVSPDATDGAGLTFGEVVLLPGQGHDRYNHPESGEII